MQTICLHIHHHWRRRLAMDYNHLVGQPRRRRRNHNLLVRGWIDASIKSPYWHINNAKLALILQYCRSKWSWYINLPRHRCLTRNQYHLKWKSSYVWQITSLQVESIRSCLTIVVGRIVSILIKIVLPLISPNSNTRVLYWPIPLLCSKIRHQSLPLIVEDHPSSHEPGETMKTFSSRMTRFIRHTTSSDKHERKRHTSVRFVSRYRAEWTRVHYHVDVENDSTITSQKKTSSSPYR